MHLVGNSMSYFILCLYLLLLLTELSGKHWYEGKTCHKNSFSVEKTCDPFQSSCPIDYPCVSVYRGSFSPNVRPACLFRNKRFTNNPACNDTSSANRTFQSGFVQGKWFDKRFDLAECEYNWYCPNDLVEPMKGYVFIYLGDRQVSY